MTGEMTQPHVPIFTEGFRAQPDPVQPLVAEREPLHTPTGPLPVVVHPAVVPGHVQHLKRWVFVLVVAAVWIVGAACGVGLYYWWFYSFDKTPSVFVVALFVVVCSVGGVLTAMIGGDKPVVTALAIAVMSAPLAALGGAAVLHGTY